MLAMVLSEFSDRKLEIDHTVAEGQTQELFSLWQSGGAKVFYHRCGGTIGKRIGRESFSPERIKVRVEAQACGNGSIGRVVDLTQPACLASTQRMPRWESSILKRVLGWTRAQKM
jgi:hypothetical protein